MVQQGAIVDIEQHAPHSMAVAQHSPMAIFILNYFVLVKYFGQCVVQIESLMSCLELPTSSSVFSQKVAGERRQLLEVTIGETYSSSISFLFEGSPGGLD